MRDKLNDIPYLGVRKDIIKNAKPKLNKENLRFQCHYIMERYEVFKKREQGLPYPWTDDPIIKNNSFVNIKRYHDRTTRWMLNNITNESSLSYKDKVFQSILFRLYNKVETAEIIGLGKDFDWNYDKVLSKIYDSEYFKSGTDFYTYAYRVCRLKVGLNKLYPDDKYIQTKAARFIIDVYHNLDKDICKEWNILLECRNNKNINAIDVTKMFKSRIYGVSDFLSLQLFWDLAYIDEFPISVNHYAEAGPTGCSRGLDFIFEDYDGMTKQEALFWYSENIDMIMSELNMGWNMDKMFDNLPKEERWFSPMDVENLHCEYGKYLRLKHGTMGKFRYYHYKDN